MGILVATGGYGTWGTYGTYGAYGACVVYGGT